MALSKPRLAVAAGRSAVACSAAPLLRWPQCPLRVEASAVAAAAAAQRATGERCSVAGCRWQRAALGVAAAPLLTWRRRPGKDTGRLPPAGARCLATAAGAGAAAKGVREFPHQYINGEWVASTAAPKTLDVVDSNTARVIATVPNGSPEDIDEAVRAARAAFPGWAATPLSERKAYISKVLANFKKRRAEVVDWLLKELGCTRAFAERVQSRSFELHAGVLLNLVDSVEWCEAAGTCTVVKEPLGVVGCITPWNYPLNQISLKIAPAMLAGCTVVLKPSEVTPVNAYLLAEAIHEAGLPKGVFNMVLGEGPTCGERLVENPDVDLISFTGSTRAGKRINEVAAQTLKQVRTELGGKSAALLLDDADFKDLVPTFVEHVMRNSGQSCNALSRLIVPRSRYDEAVGLARDVAERTVVGRADDPKATIGPLVSQVQWDRVQSYLEAGVREGARVVTGGPGKPDGLEDGFFAKPTIFADVDNSMTIAREEIFGPVVSVIPYDTEEEGVSIANDTIYGLNNAVGSSDPKRALKVASQLRSGMVMVNSTKMDPAAPFGGYKQSGNAREWGKYGLEEFLITKTINLSLEEYKAAIGQ